MFKLIRQQEIKSLEVEYFEFEHEVTKARHIHLKADDKENTFITVFETASNNSTGIAHILEHCVLQGSKDFPLKGPFWGILKQSLKTFLNALTGPLRTSYPHASENKKDFFNLMHVTTNAAFFPLLRKEDFLQEGWRYEFSEPTNPESQLTYKGVVFNEMKGAMSDADTKLYYAISKELYPNTIFAENSGGDPKNITDLSYEEFCEFHKKFYHPSNAIFFSYGDIPYNEIQEKLEEYVLKDFKYQTIEKTFKKTSSLTKTKNISTSYPLLVKKGDNSKNSYIKTWHICEAEDIDTQLAFNFISDLIGADISSIMKAKIEESGLVKSSVCDFDSDSYNFSMIIGGEGVAEQNIPALDKLINDVLIDLTKNGFEEKIIQKEFHQFELERKTKSKGSMPYGLGLLYNIVSPVINKLDPIEILDVYTPINKLKGLIKQDKFFENIIQEKLIDNKHRVDLFFKADKELYEEELKDEPARLAEIQKNLTEVQKSEIVENYKKLTAHQDAEEDLSVLPEFSVADIPENIDIQDLESQNYNGTTVYAFKAPTAGLTYVSKKANLKDIKFSDLPYVSTYSMLSGVLGFGEFSYKQAQEEKYNICSDLSIATSIGADKNNRDNVYLKVFFGSKMLHENVDKFKPLMDEFVEGLRFDESEHIKKKIKEYALGFEKSYHSNGHVRAIEMASANFSKVENAGINFTGVHYTEFLVNLAKNIDDDKVYNEFISKLKEIHEKVKEAYSRSALFVADIEENLQKDIEIFCDETIVTELEKFHIEFDSESNNSEICLSKSDVNYCAMSCKTIKRTHELAGANTVLSKIISKDFTHYYLREKGGAYGGFCGGNSAEGFFFLASYRDPGISKTFDVYRNLKDWLKTTEITQDQIEQGILQAIAQFDAPSLKVDECMGAFNRFLAGRTVEEVLEYRNKILNTNLEQIQTLVKDYIIPELDNAKFAAIVNKEQYKSEGLNMKTMEI
ncbi:MAG: hypothetical protein GY793_00395 [Proteobacteria bacterium]|nr:hypothetical protein [Pseudomonadota bacterium]